MIYNSCISLGEKSCKNLLSPSFLLFCGFSITVLLCTLILLFAATASTMTDDVTNWFTNGYLISTYNIAVLFTLKFDKI